MALKQRSELFRRAEQLIPGGVNSPVRAMRAVGLDEPVFMRSLYFREPNGVLFEIATDGPGFGVDEDEATLGEKIVLAPFLEPRREQIVANLKPLD